MREYKLFQAAMRPLTLRSLRVCMPGVPGVRALVRSWGIGRSAPAVPARQVQANSWEDLLVISGVYRQYIERGEACTEAVLIKALNQYGTAGMATDFLTCGNNLLDTAAKEWAEANNYTILTASIGGTLLMA